MQKWYTYEINQTRASSLERVQEGNHEAGLQSKLDNRAEQNQDQLFLLQSMFRILKDSGFYSVQLSSFVKQGPCMSITRIAKGINYVSKPFYSVSKWMSLEGLRFFPVTMRNKATLKPVISRNARSKFWWRQLVQTLGPKTSSSSLNNNVSLDSVSDVRSVNKELLPTAEQQKRKACIQR